MATEVVNVVDPDSGAGYDYASLNAWEAGENGDLTGERDEIAIAKCRSTSGSADTTTVILDGWTTSATQYIKIWTDPEESYRHDSTWDTSAYRLETSALAFVLEITEEYVVIDGLQIASSYSGTACHSIYYRYVEASNQLTVANTVLKNVSGAGIKINDSDAVAKIYNCIVLECTTGSLANGIYVDDAATVDIFNCTIANTADSGILRDAGTATVKNCAVLNTNDDFEGTITIDYCASDDEDGDHSQALDGTDNYANEFVDAPAGDFHLVVGSCCIGNGTDDPGSGLYSDDIDGEARTSPWDIGAFEYVSGGETYNESLSEGFSIGHQPGARMIYGLGMSEGLDLDSGERPRLQYGLNREELAEIREILSVIGNMSVVWGHDSGVSERNVRNFSDWTGTGTVDGSGDSEKISLEEGQYLESPDWETGEDDFEIDVDKYGSGLSAGVTVEYKTAASQAGLSGQGWTEYTEKFTSLGWVKIKVTG